MRETINYQKSYCWFGSQSGEENPMSETGFPECTFPKWCSWKICKTGCFFAGKCGWKGKKTVSSKQSEVK